MWKGISHVTLFIVTACALTWPLATHLTTHLPLGTEPSATVPLFNLWTLRWNTEQLLTGYRTYWDAPIFHPTLGAFALSDPQPLTGALFALPYILTDNQALAYNLTLLLTLTLNGYAASYLIGATTATRPAALLGGLLAQGLPFVSNEFGVIQLTALFPIFFALAALYTFTQTPTRRPALALGLWLAATFLTSSYYGLFLTLFLAVSMPVLMRRDLLRAQPVVYAIVGAGLAALLLLPVLPAQAQLTSGYSRSDATIRRNSAQPADFLRLGSRAWGRTTLPWLRERGGSGQRLYPGAGLLAVALLGVAQVWVTSNQSTIQRRWIAFCLIGASLATLLSLGLNLQIGGWQPYTLLHDYIPGFQQLRSPFRFAIFTQIFLVSLAGHGLALLWQWGAKGARTTNNESRTMKGFCSPLHRVTVSPCHPLTVSPLHLVTVALVALSLLEVIALPIRLYALPGAITRADWIEWLREQPPGAAVMVPFAEGGSASDFEPTTVAMLQALEHGHPLANGYSGLFPSSHSRLRAAMERFPNARSLTLLRRDGISYIIIEREWLTPGRKRLLAASGLRQGFVGTEKLIYVSDERRTTNDEGRRDKRQTTNVTSTPLLHLHPCQRKRIRPIKRWINWLDGPDG